jgi:hypothetical protein
MLLAPTLTAITERGREICTWNLWLPRPRRPARVSYSGRPPVLPCCPAWPFADVHGGDPGQAAVVRAVVTGPERSFAQDPLLAFRLLADIALRALSPAVNDPATAVQAIDSLEGLLSLLATRTNRGDQLTDDVGAVRVILSLPRWEDFARSRVDDSLARKFPLIWADTATARRGQLATQPPASG